jgi:hypothetical protein
MHHRFYYQQQRDVYAIAADGLQRTAAEFLRNSNPSVGETLGYNSAIFRAYVDAINRS